MLAAEAAGWFLEHAWLIPLIPAVAFFIILLFGKFEVNGKRVLPWGGSEIGIASMVASLVLSIGTTYQWIHHVRGVAEAEPVIRTWTWWQSGGLKFGIGEHIDGLSVMMLLLVSFISTLVQIYSLEYVRGDRRYTHFFASITLFSAGMLTMVLAENMVLLIVGWEIMGLCSFLLIGHWWEERANSEAALKAFLTVRVGDIGMLVGTAIMFGASGTFSITELHAWANDPVDQPHRVAVVCGRSVHRRDRQERPVPTAHLAPRCHGRPHARQLAVALVDDGRCRRVPRGTSVPRVPRRADDQRRGTTLQPDRRDRWHHHLDRRGVGVRAERHQEGSGLLDGQPTRLHDDGARRRRLGPGRVPHLHPRVLQVLPVPVRRLRQLTPAAITAST